MPLVTVEETPRPPEVADPLPPGQTEHVHPRRHPLRCQVPPYILVRPRVDQCRDAAPRAGPQHDAGQGVLLKQCLHHAEVVAPHHGPSR